ncbi:hypothetical protein NKI15_28895 [Mesorhizobium sp. M0862]|uniref:hypothetical protein n=1 Tax=Mesorhizobium sp. M0862 TaxID=2957015 RepID=UPI003336EBC8
MADCEPSAQQRLFFKGLILLAAAGVKIRGGKRVAAARHAARAAALFRQVTLLPSRPLEAALGMTPAALAVDAEAAKLSRLFYQSRRLTSLSRSSISFSGGKLIGNPTGRFKPYLEALPACDG